MPSRINGTTRPGLTTKLCDLLIAPWRFDSFSYSEKCSNLRVALFFQSPHCGVMKFGRHAPLSRGWGSQDKHCITPILLQQDRLGLTTSRFGLAAHTIDVLCQLPRGGSSPPPTAFINGLQLISAGRLYFHSLLSPVLCARFAIRIQTILV